MSSFVLSPAQESKLHKMPEASRIIGIEDEDLLVEYKLPRYKKPVIRKLCRDGRLRIAGDYIIWKIKLRRESLQIDTKNVL